MTLVEFFNRMATKRAVVFFKSNDEYVLRNGEGGIGSWDLVGTEQDGTKKSDPKLAYYMSYDELMISAMCGISSVTHFINNGTRRNLGRCARGEGVWMYLNTVDVFPCPFLHFLKI